MNALMNRGWHWLAFSMISVLVAGCGGSSGLKTISASGKISYKGEPLQFGTVTFSPVDPQVAAATSAPIMNGHFQTEKGQGVTAGDYKVVVNVQRIPPDLNETSKQKSKPGGKPAREFLIPQKYSSYKTTDLELNVAKNAGSVSKNFDLQD